MAAEVTSGGIMITGAEDIERVRWLSVRSALKLETRGMQRRGKSARVLANEITGKNHRLARVAYMELNAHIVKHLGEEFNRPL